MTLPALRLPAVAALALILAACAKTPPPPPADAPAPAAQATLVKPAERSPHFMEVDRRLELGGVLYGYVDVDGDALSLARQTQTAAKAVVESNPQLSMYAKQDFKELFTMMGFDDIKAVGVSSVREATGQYRNRAFLYTPAGRQGLLAIFGGAPAPFTTTKMAPADTDYFAEHEIDLKAVYDTIEAVVSKVDGPDAATSFREQARKLGASAGISLLDLFQGLKGRVTFFSVTEPDKVVPVPGIPNLSLPGSRFLLRIEGAGPALRPMVKVASTGEIASKEGPIPIYPLSTGTGVMAFKGTTFYLSSGKDFLSECLERTDGGLDTNPAFKAALADLGPNGNGLTWVTPKVFNNFRHIVTQNPNAPAQFRTILEIIALSMPESTAPVLSIRTNLPDGILIRSHWNRSLKADLAVMTVYNPVTVGLLAAIAVPAFQKTRQNAQSIAVVRNLTALHNASEAYCIAHQVDEASYDLLVGPGLLVPEITPVAGEDYRSLTYRKGWALAIRLPDGRRFVYPPTGLPYARPSASGSNGSGTAAARPVRRNAPTVATGTLNPADQGIYDNLRILNEAAEKYYAANGTTFVTYDQLVGPGKLVPAITPVRGENYGPLLFKQGRPLHLHMPDGHEVIYPTPSTPSP